MADLTLSPITRRVQMPTATFAARALSIQIALTESLARWRLELDAAERHLQDALEADDAESVEWYTDEVTELRAGIRDLCEEMGL